MQDDELFNQWSINQIEPVSLKFWVIFGAYDVIKLNTELSYYQ